MSTGKPIRTDWASITPTYDGGFIIGARPNGGSCNIHFPSSKRLKEALDKKKIKVKRWVAAVPRNQCILKEITLPAENIQEAINMLEFELPSLAPIPLYEIVYGGLPLAQKDGMLNILVCIVKVGKLKTLLADIADLGIEPQRVVLSSMAFYNWFDNIIKSENDAVKIMAVFDAARGEVLTGRNHTLFTSSYVTLSDNDAAPSFDKISHEITSQKQQLSEPHEANVNIWLGSRQEYASLLKQQLSPAEHINTIQIDAFPRINFYDDNVDATPEENYLIESIMAQGMADLSVRSRWPFFNLLPSDLLQKRSKSVLLRKSIWSASLAALSIILLWLTLGAMNWRIDKRCQLLEREMAPISNIAQSIESKQQQLKAVRRQMMNRNRITGILEDLYKHTPEHISLSELSYTARPVGGEIHIKGQANTLAGALNYTEAMRDAALLNNMEVENAQQVSRLGGSVVEFTSHCTLK